MRRTKTVPRFTGHHGFPPTLAIDCTEYMVAQGGRGLSAVISSLKTIIYAEPDFYSLESYAMLD